jgi:hypothetical protein
MEETAVAPVAVAPKDGQKLKAKRLLNWLFLLNTNLGLRLEEASLFCDQFGQKLEFQESNQSGNWFQCGGAEGYTLSCDQDGVVQYVADNNFPLFTLENIQSVLGTPKKAVHQDGVTLHMWVLSGIRGLPPRTLCFVIPDDHESPPFVSIRLWATAVKEEAAPLKGTTI